MKEQALRAELLLVVEPFKHENDEVKRKMRPLYRVAMNAIELAEKYQDEIRSFKSPKLGSNPEVTPVHLPYPKIFTSRVERIRWHLDNDPSCPKFHRFLKWNGLTIESAIEMAKGEI